MGDPVEEQLLRLGVERGGVLLVHCSFSKVKPVDGGPAGLIEALRRTLGSDGTLVMPSMTDDDDVPFDPATAPCAAMGVVASTFWRMPGVRRSNSPHAFAAIGPKAETILAPHPVEVPHGLDSPAGRVLELGGHVLLLGIGHDADTTIHVAEGIAGVRYRIPRHATVLENGKPIRIDYMEIDSCCERFDLVDGWLDERGLQRRGVVGHGEARLARARDIVEVVVEHLRNDDLAFLHPPGVDAECDEARANVAPE